MIFQRIFVWFKRCTHSRGFGVQSPNDYRFVRYVINEHYPYYAYSELKKTNPEYGWLYHKLGRLYFRIANHCQPKTVINLLSEADLYDQYIRRGCLKARIYHDVNITEKADIILISDNSIPLADIFGLMHPHSILIVEGIKKNEQAKQLWNIITETESVKISFDLYYAGVALLDEKRYKQHYKINF